MTAGSRHDLGAAELEILRELWEESPAPVRRVLERLHARGRRVAYTTVQTVLTRLEQKGFVSSDRSGQAYVYRPLVTRERLSRTRIRTLLNQLFDGAAGPLVLQLVKTQKLTPAELDELQRLIGKLDGGGRS